MDVTKINAIEKFLEEDNCQIGIGLRGMGAVTAFYGYS